MRFQQAQNLDENFDQIEEDSNVGDISVTFQNLFDDGRVNADMFDQNSN